MLRSLFTAASGMSAQQLNVDVIANNISNVNSTGFKRSRVDFQDVLYQTERVPGTATSSTTQVPTGIQVGLGTRPGAVFRIFSQGTFQQTGNPLDLVIEGDGFFQVLKPDGEIAFTRDGALKLDFNGRVVNSDGIPLEPDITIPQEAQSISVGMDGTVSVTLPQQPQPQEVGQLQLVRFLNPAGLQAEGRNLFVQTFASGEPINGIAGEEGLGSIAQGFLEMSNVKVVEEMVQMIIALRAYEVNSKAIQTSDEMLSIANNVRR